MPAFDRLQKAKFGEEIFPITRVTVEGGVRDHVHEYPHTPGGSVEKMGRKLYTIRMEAWFGTNVPGYPKDLWPGVLGRLRANMERQRTLPLVIPTIGSIPAYAVDWNQTQDVKTRSGETASFTFREDQPGQFLAANVLVLDYAKLSNAGKLLADSADVVPFYEQKNRKVGIFEWIDSAINEVLAIKDQQDVAAAMVSSRLQRIAHYCDLVDDLISGPDTELVRIREALHDVWASANKLAEDITGTGAIGTFIVPRVMTVTDASRAIWNGDGTRGIELMQMNAIEDPFEIPERMPLRYFKA